MRLLAFAALGVVFGDIGTSPLYALKECFKPEYGIAPTVDNVIGICSLFFWAITFVVVVKYIIFVMRADNNGEGGILALLALAVPRLSPGMLPRGAAAITTLLALIGTGLLGADGTITPAISVLSALEGLEVATPKLEPVVLPLTVVILVALFWIQRHGTARISRLFAPAMFLWFLTLIIIAIPPLVHNPGIFAALNPARGVDLLLRHGFRGFMVLGAVVLCITGAEALYADMGHFGRRAIEWAWFVVVFPALVINYLGQGALILERGGAVLDNPFYALAPDWAQYPLVAISTVATIIASQALISGSFSLAQQAIQLGYSPRLTIVHTSGEQRGQIYVPEVNTLLMVTCVGLVLAFRTSSALASAYGIAVMGTMTITSLLIFLVAKRLWKWPAWKAVLLLVVFLAVDLPFLTANAPKVATGGWIPLMICAGVVTVMTTWKRGRAAFVRRMQSRFISTKEFVAGIRRDQPHRVDGVGVFMTSNPSVVPPALQQNYLHNRILHKSVVLLSILTEGVPTYPARDALEITDLGEGIYEIVVRFGFMQHPRIDRILRLVRAKTGFKLDESRISYYLGRDVLLLNGPERMARWRKFLFAYILRNSLSATAYFGIPPDRVVELGMQVSL